MDKAELVRTITDAYERLAALVDRVPDERLLEPAMDDWTGKDLLVHIAWWHGHSADVIDGLLAGREPYDGTDPANTTDGFNARVHREHLDDPVGEVRPSVGASFERLLAALEPLTDDDLFEATRWPWLGREALVETILWDTQRHYEEHDEHLTRMAR
jgi:hypothetical protein